MQKFSFPRRNFYLGSCGIEPISRVLQNEPRADMAKWKYLEAARETIAQLQSNVQIIRPEAATLSL